jgi:hypothetical protein
MDQTAKESILINLGALVALAEQIKELAARTGEELQKEETN